MPQRLRCLRVLVMLAFALTLAGCFSLPGRQDPASREWSEATAGARTQAVFAAIQMVGAPYRWGGSSPASGFDCSGLVQYAFVNAGLRLPRTAAEQLQASAPLPLDHAEAGDLLFFREQGRTSHVAIYLGEGRFVHAPSSGRTVSLDSFDNDYWRKRFTRAGRVAPVPADPGS